MCQFLSLVQKFNLSYQRAIKLFIKKQFFQAAKLKLIYDVENSQICQKIKRFNKNTLTFASRYLINSNKADKMLSQVFAIFNSSD